MKGLKIILLFLFFSTIKLSAQYSLETFLNESFDKDITSIKEKLVGKKIEEKDVMIYKTILYYDWFEPVSVKAGFMFRKNGSLNGKVLTNGKDNEEESKKLFDKLKPVLINKFGSNYSENSMMGTTIFSWKDVENYIVTLTFKSVKTVLMIVKK